MSHKHLTISERESIFKFLIEGDGITGDQSNDPAKSIELVAENGTDGTHRYDDSENLTHDFKRGLGPDKGPSDEHEDGV